MEFIELIIIIAVLITFSNILTKMMPTVPIFFAQIFLGILLGLSKYGSEIEFKPEMFLVLIIAPLLFREGKNADTRSIVENLGPVLFLAFAGVLLTMTAVGFTLYAFIPNIPLAACLAFGAALGPTDAVAVGSLAKRLKMPEKVLHILEGEGLLNDASGVTAFQFAVSTLVTGVFSLFDASVSLLFSSIGGALVGIFVIWVKNRVIHFLERTDSQDVISYLLIELLLPFVAYVLSELLGFSGIIAAVIAGVLQSKRQYRVTVFDAELANISANIWSTIGFTLNALVFLFLGIELSEVFRPVWSDRTYSNVELIAMVLLIVLVIFLVRFLYVGLFHFFKERKQTKRTGLHELLLLTFGGVKGTISLATVFILPVSIHGVAFEQRALLLFLTACVIFISLLVGMFALPLLSEGEYEKPVDRAELQILQSIIRYLQMKRARKELSAMHVMAIETVIEQYRQRSFEIMTEAMTETEQAKVQELQGWFLTTEQAGLDDLYQKKKISEKSYRIYNRLLEYYELVGKQRFLSLSSFWLLAGRRILRNIVHPKRYMIRKKRAKRHDFSNVDVDELKSIFVNNTILIRKQLKKQEGNLDPQILSYLDNRRSLILKQLYERDVIEPELVENSHYYKQELVNAYTFERRQIDAFEREEKINPLTANSYRQKVNLLESFALQKQGR
ncbi:cation:proton antiporter [Tetragenococcus solitarius]|uniref:Sodium:proton antiporter n=1 Tax=Tetragenococcus solitarius TaxID=71453 RepID=A0ABP6KP64_9ENTE|nr:sodium:proton antiporter [Tetragenococcus solitarius]